MQVSKGIETTIKEGIEEMVVDKYKYRGGVEEGIKEMFFDRYRYRGGVEEQSIRFKNISSIYPLAVEKLSRRQELSRSIHQVSRSCRDCDMKKLKELDR